MSGSPTDSTERLRRWEHWLALCQERALDADMAIVDPHHHLWDRGGHTFLPEQFAAQARAGGHRLVSSVYVECLSQYLDSGPVHLRPAGETAYVAGLAQPVHDAGEGSIAAGIVAYADLSLADTLDDLLDAHEQAGGGRLRGIRYSTAHDTDPAIHSVYPTRPGMLREPAVQAGARRLARRGLALDIWLYFHQLDDVLALARACPDLTIVLDHAGGPLGLGPYAGQRAEVFERWRAALQLLRGQDNIQLKFGGLAMPLAGFEWRKLPQPPGSVMLASAWQPYWDVCLDIFGPRRCMFESNFPVDRSGCTYTALWNAFKRLAAPLTAAERQLVMAGTAQRVYRI